MKINKIAFAVLTALAAAPVVHAGDNTTSSNGGAPTSTTATTPTVSTLTATSSATTLSAPTDTTTAPDATSTTTDKKNKGTNTLQTVTVTAERSNEDIQNVPITMQAFSGDQLKTMNVETFDDVIKYLPNVEFAENGPGQGNIFMRGLSTGFLGNQSSATIAPFPNVAVYLDDQSMQFPSRNLDVYMVDMERVEVLEGPQGTLFGGGAEAGAVRYITNKPDPEKMSGSVDAGYGVTSGGAPNNSANAVLNLPLIKDVFAIRGVIYSDHRGGYIDNVPSTYSRSNNDAGNFYANIKPTNGVCPNGLGSKTGYCAVPGSPVANNSSVAGSDFNPVTYTGARLSGLYQFNDDWSLLIAQSYQNMSSDGEFSTYPVGSAGQTLGPLQTTVFAPTYDKDSYNNTAWTLTGKIGDLNAVYTGGYTDRHINEQQDYTNYNRSVGGWYYSCTGGTGLAKGTTPTCYSPVGSWHDQVNNTHLSQEFRLSTPDDWRLRAIGGLYYENFEIKDNMNFNYKTIASCTPTNLTDALAGGAPCLANVVPAPNSNAADPNVRGDTTAFGEDAQRGYKQFAAFGSVSYDIVPDILTLTAGTRYYHYSESETGSQYSTGAGCLDVPNGECSPGATSITAENLHDSYHGFKSRANLVWHVTPDSMVYYTFSQGFRPGAFNRTVSAVADGPDGAQYEKPHSYAPDTLTNNEIGFKTEFFDNHLLLNGSVYHMNWYNVQMLFFNPLVLGNTTFGVNGPNYQINGAELQLDARIGAGFSVQGSASYNHSRQTNSPCLIGNIPGVPAYGQCITQVVEAGLGVQPFQNPFGSVGGVPAFSPTSQFTVRPRYDWSFNGYKAFIMAGVEHVGSMYNQPNTYLSGSLPSEAIPTTVLLRYLQPGYTTYDLSIGVAKGQWNASLYGTNLGNNHASVFTSSAQFIKSEVPLRPRVMGVKFGYTF